MKTKDIVFGGIMVSFFLLLGYVFRSNARIVQSYLQVVKIVVVAITVRNLSNPVRWIFCTAALFTSFFLISLQDTVIYNIPALAGGIVLGLQEPEKRLPLQYILFFITNTILTIYEFLVYQLFTQINMFLIYKDVAYELSNLVFEVSSDTTVVYILFFIFVFFDSAFSSFVIFSLYRILAKKVQALVQKTE